MFKNHLIPRSRKGKLVTLTVLCLYLLIQWPILQFANRMEPFVLGMPFLYVYLLFIYCCIIAVMVYACLQDL